MEPKQKKSPGRPPLFGVPVKNHPIAMTPEMAIYIEFLGEGNRSEGVRRLVRWHKGEGEKP